MVGGPAWALDRPQPPVSPPWAPPRAAPAPRQSELTKPLGALGLIEKIAIDLAAVQRRSRPRASDAAIVLFAGDHGVTAQGISAFPSEVTAQMLQNFANGGAAISVLSRAQGVPLSVIDVGTLSDAEIAGVVTDKPCRGTADFSSAPAMTPDELAFALAAGRRAVAAAGSRDVLLFGEMGIGNTTSAAALACALTGRAAGELVGAGTGLDAMGQERKARVVSDALDLHGCNGADVLHALRCVGGLEIAALTGAIIAAAQAGVPVLVDGFIVTAAALAAVRINPDVRPYLIFSHRSHEQGHGILLDAMDAAPLLSLDMRLGEGSGAALALPLLRHACALHNDMATFAEAAVSGSG
ncbi:MAG: nicotinate-nucleotide--dimethylbenzimidazole phosphoribosyltransferase [Pseudomonadota bacterium]